MEAKMNRKIYVGNLPLSFESDDLEFLFRNYGNIISTKVFSYAGSEYLGKYGFVEMASEQEAKNVIVQLNNFNLTGRRITVAQIVPR
jgi:RNA recognition motif-containing protein